MKKKAPKKIVNKIRNLAKKGKVKFSGDVVRIDPVEPNFT